jgi:four helix bundle protein
VNSSGDDARTFETLEVWKKGRDFRNSISELVEKFPENEEYQLRDQLLRSSRSITANIAEGYGRFHYQENLQFCRQSRGSLFETLDHLSVALDERYIDDDEFESYKKDFEKLLRLINGYIAYIKKKKTEDNDQNDTDK